MNSFTRTFLFIIFLQGLIVSNTFANNNPVIVGAERQELYLPMLQGQRVGLLVNPTSMIGQTHLVDSLVSKNINIQLIFAPEHGFRGDHGAGEKVKDDRDPKTGIAIVSLHGKTKKPSPHHMKQLDIMIFDIQDVGVRFYTYISSMHYLMEACAESKIPLIVFDRPNPNGDYIDGPILEDDFSSFVGMHPIPLVHGLTVGELARMINGERWLKDGNQCELTVIKIKNYDHETFYSLPVPPSPNLPSDLSIRLYPSLGLFEATAVSVGRGTDWPFQVLGYPNKEMGEFSFSPAQIRGSWSKLNYAGERLYGEKITVFPKLGEIDLDYFLAWNKKFKQQKLTFISRPKFLAKLSGSNDLLESVDADQSSVQIKSNWQLGLKRYQKIRKKYLLYRDSKLILDKYAP